MKSSSDDHRIRVTRMLIRRAFTDLLSHKPIQSISIKELCEKAGIHRGTFYAHYTDIYDLLHSIEEEMLEDFDRVLQPMLSAKEGRLHPVEISAEIFQCLKDNSDLCTVTLGDYGDKNFALRLINIGRDRCAEAYRRYFHQATPLQIDYFYAFVSAGCIGLLRRWLDDGMTLTAQEMATMAENLILHGIGALGSSISSPLPKHESAEK